MAATFDLSKFEPVVPVTLTEATVAAGLTQEKLLNFHAFSQWCDTIKDSLSRQHTDSQHPFHEKPYALRTVTVNSVTFFGPVKVGFIKFDAKISNEDNSELPGTTFMRGGSVAVLMILRPRDSIHERFVVMTDQARVPAGSLSFLEIPAGMIDSSTGTFTGTAAKEIQEETGIGILEEELIDMTALALEDSKSSEHLQKAMYPSPGGCDEYIPLMLWEMDMDRIGIEDLRNKLSGLRFRGEMITLRLSKYEDLWREGARDAKTLAAWALYEGLGRSGRLQEEKDKREKARTKQRAEV